jgi:CHAT domain-containing protein
VIGISWAFFAAGCPSTAAGLWKLEDKATKALMTEFHRNLHERGMGKADALRQAQLGMLKRFDMKTGELRGLGSTPVKLNPKQAPPPPFFWAGFVLIGSGR